MVDKKNGLGRTLKDIEAKTKLPNTLIASEAADKIHQLITIDSLTGLLNKNSFEDFKNHFDPQRQDKSLLVIVLDLNNLKETNDTLGHDAGNQLLKNMAHILTSSFRKTDKLYRFGGDEFIAICETDLDPEHIEIILERLKENTDKINLNNNKLNLSYAVGIGKFDNKNPNNLEDVFNQADREMYQNKAVMKGQEVPLASNNLLD